MQVNKRQLAWSALILMVGLTIGVGIATLSGRTRPAPIHISPPPPTATAQPEATAAPLHVYISGEVVEPEVYTVPPGSILQDVVVAAGGFTDAAETSVVNLALTVSDGMHIHVPAQGAGSVAPVVTSPEGAVAIPTGERININTATLEQLDLLPGIGPAIGQRIIDYREVNGPFASLEEVNNVSGIGPAKFEEIQDLITID
jgi:competence protein ComEA